MTSGGKASLHFLAIFKQIFGTLLKQQFTHVICYHVKTSKVAVTPVNCNKLGGGGVQGQG